MSYLGVLFGRRLRCVLGGDGAASADYYGKGIWRVQVPTRTSLDGKSGAFDRSMQHHLM